MATVFVVDGNWYLHRVWFTLRTSRPIEEVLPYNFVSLIMKDACALKASHILVAFDGNKIFRYDIYPEYKANRKETKGTKSGEDEDGGKQIYEYLDAVRRYLTAAGICWVQKPKYEADDVNASASVQYTKIPKVKVVNGSKDKDGYQVLSDRVKAYDSSAKPNPVFITKEKAEKSKGVSVEHMVMYQALIGDSIDNIPTLMTPAPARKAINKWGSFKAWFAGADEKERIWLRKNQVKLRLNRQLVELKTDLSLPPLDDLKIARMKKEGMPKSWYVFQDLTYPKTKGLFRR